MATPYRIYFNGISYYVSMFSRNVHHILINFFPYSIEELHTKRDELQREFNIRHNFIKQ